MQTRKLFWIGEPVETHGTAYMFVNIVQKGFDIHDNYGVPLRSKYPDSEMLFQKQKISRDVQNMMPKIKTYRSIPKKKICTSSSSLLIRSRKFSMTSRIKKIRLPKKNIRSRDFKSRLREDADQRHRGFCHAWGNSSTVVGR